MPMIKGVFHSDHPLIPRQSFWRFVQCKWRGYHSNLHHEIDRSTSPHFTFRTVEVACTHCGSLDYYIEQLSFYPSSVPGGSYGSGSSVQG